MEAAFSPFRKRENMKSLWLKIAGSFALLIVATVVGLLLLINGQVKKTNAVLTETLTEKLVEAKVAQIDGWLQQRTGELKVITENTPLVAMNIARTRQYLRALGANHREEFESFAIATLEGDAWTSDDIYIDIRDRDYFKRITSENLDYVVSEPIISKSNNEPIVVIIHAIRDAAGNQVGFVNGAIRLSRLSDVASEIALYDSTGWICDANGDILTQRFDAQNTPFNIHKAASYGYVGFERVSAEMMNGGSGMTPITMPDGVSSRVFYAPIPSADGWSVGIIIEEKAIDAPTHQLVISIAILGGLMGACALGVAIVIARSIVRPVKAMQGLMAIAEGGDLTVRCENPSGDEIGRLGESFNEMIVQIESLMQKVYREEQGKRLAELMALQSQINPHFLYNTLDTIHWMALDYDAEDVADMITSLSELLRLSINRGREIIDLKGEIAHIQHYLFIQKVRYDDQMTYAITCDSALETLPVMKLLLQPIVENAIYHGIKTKRAKGHIAIEVTVSDEHLVMTVTDDGVGMSPKRLETVRRMLDETYQQATYDGYGLFNVHKRLQLAFGKEYGVSVESTPQVGTRVTLCHPILEEGAAYENFNRR